MLSFRWEIYNLEVILSVFLFECVNQVLAIKRTEVKMKLAQRRRNIDLNAFNTL